MYFRISICSKSQRMIHQPPLIQSTLYYSLRNHYRYIVMIVMYVLNGVITRLRLCSFYYRYFLMITTYVWYRYFVMMLRTYWIKVCMAEWLDEHLGSSRSRVENPARVGASRRSRATSRAPVGFPYVDSYLFTPIMMTHSKVFKNL